LAELINLDDSTRTDIESFLQTTLQSYIDLRNIADQYYFFSTFTDRWVEYDRCYSMRARNDRSATEYQGWSNIVLPDFHDKIETLRVREMNTFFSGAELFETKSRKRSTEEDASLAKKLVKYNFDCVELRSETSRMLLDKYLYGTWIAYAPYTEEDVRTKVLTDIMVDKQGNPIEIDGVIQKTEPYVGYEVREKKFTDLQYINLKKAYVHPRIKDIQDQPAIFISREVTYQDLLDMEENGDIEDGMAEYVKEHNNENELDSDVEDAEDQKANDSEIEDEVRVYDLFYGYFWWGEDDDDRKMYEAIHNRDGKVLGIKDIQEERYPFISGQHIKTDGFYGIGAGDELYAPYIAKCTRFNQVFDLSTFEIKGGGFKDATSLPDFDNLVPGEYKAVTGLSAMLASKGKPILSWGDIRGSFPSSTGLDITQELDRAMQTGSGAVQLLSGMPTDSQVDKTAAGIEATISEGNARINNYIEDFEDQFFKRYAEMCYANFQDKIDPKEDIPKILDEEDYTYVDVDGQVKMVQFPNILRDVDIVFVAAKRILESEKQIGKIQRFMQIMGGVMGVNPEFGQALLRRTDYKYLTEEIARSLGITDLDKLFPNVNVTQELIDTQKELQAVSMEAEMMSAGVEQVMNKLNEVGDQAALKIINDTMMEMQEGMQGEQGMGAAPQGATTAV